MSFRRYNWTKWEPPIKNLKNSEIEDGKLFDEDSATKTKYIGKMLFTHTGLFSISEHEYSSDVFDFWYLNTNFDITESVFKAIEKTAGVESTFLVTRYKIRIGFPKSGLFDIEKAKKFVEQNIEKETIYSSANLVLANMLSCPVEIIDEIYSTYNLLDSTGGLWLIYVFPNGKIITKQYENNLFFYEDYKLYDKLYNNIGGFLVSFLHNNLSNVDMV